MNRHVLRGFLIISIIFNCEVNSQNTDQWLGTKLFHKNYLMHWKKDDINEEIIFRVEVKTRGWVGFGLSMHGVMESSDLVIGWITSDGKTHFSDRWTDRKEMPVIDRSQDWQLIHSMENSSHTVLQFKRPYKTCDTLEDVEVLDSEHQNIIWAFSDSDPISDQNIHKHDIKGVQHLRLLDPDIMPTEPPEDDLQYYDFTVENITIPKSPVSFFCKLIKLPYKQPRHVVKCGQYSEPPELHKYVFHTAIMNIDPSFPTIFDKYVGQVNECKNLPDVIKKGTSWHITQPCTAAETPFVFYTPPNAGFKIADSPSTTYFMAFIHLENPNGPEGNVLTQTMRMWHTSKLRDNDLDMITVGLNSDNGYAGIGFMVPPREPRFVLRSVVNTYCFEDRMDKNGITIDSVKIHTHSRGIEGYLRHIRGDKELEPLIDYVHFDRRFQVYHRLKRTVRILPGDQLVVSCAYNTSMDEHLLYGGEDMCLASITFWPRLKRKNNTYYGENIDDLKNVTFDANGFTTSFKYETVLNVTNLVQIDGFYDSLTPIVRRPLVYNGMTLKAYLKSKKEWIPVRQMESMFYNSPQRLFCTLGQSPVKTRLKSIAIEMPKNYIPFVGQYRQCKSAFC